MASQVQIPFEGVILQEHSAPISCPTPNFAKGSSERVFINVRKSSRIGGAAPGIVLPKPASEGISVVLRLNGFEAAAERLSQLGSVVAENPDEPSLEIESVRALASFLMSEKQLPEPQIGVPPNGLVQIEWRVPTNPHFSPGR